MSTPHLYAEILRAIADGKSIQYYRDDTWVDISTKQALGNLALRYGPPESYRVKPPIVTINGFEVPRPESKPLPNGTNYWIPLLSTSSLVGHFQWSGATIDLRNLNRGLIHLDRKDANAHALALLSFTANPVNLSREYPPKP